MNLDQEQRKRSKMIENYMIILFQVIMRHNTFLYSKPCELASK